MRASKLSLITTVGTDTTEIDEGCIRLADAKAYLDQCCIAWEVASIADPAADATKPKKGMTHAKPNWSVWHRMLKASLFDAVCLSCDVNPGAATLNPMQNGIAHLLGLDFVGWDVSREIAERLSIARSHAGTGGTLPTVTGDKDGEVYLTAFAEWAVSTMEWSVPDEFRALMGASQFPDAVGTGAPSIPAPTKTGTVRHSIIARRTNILDPEIDNAINEKGTNVNQVYPYLRERTLNGEGLFTGVAPSGALEYTDANGKVKTLTRDALAKRLNRREEADSGR